MSEITIREEKKRRVYKKHCERIRYSLYERSSGFDGKSSRLIARNRSSFRLIDTRGGIKDLALTSITLPPSVSTTRVRARDCSSPNATPYMYERVYMCTPMSVCV